VIGLEMERERQTRRYHIGSDDCLDPREVLQSAFEVLSFGDKKMETKNLSEGDGGEGAEYGRFMLDLDI
jgi:hypothetical protein